MLRYVPSRTNHATVLLVTAVSRTHQHSCGLDGLVRVTVTSRSMASLSMTSPGHVSGASGANACDGSLSDWSPFTCTLTSSMVLTYRNCTSDNALVHKGEWFIVFHPPIRLQINRRNNHWRLPNLRCEYSRIKAPSIRRPPPPWSFFLPCLPCEYGNVSSFVRIPNRLTDALVCKENLLWVPVFFIMNSFDAIGSPWL